MEKLPVIGTRVQSTMDSEDSEQAGQTGKLIPSEAVTPLTPSRLAAKRPLTVDSPEGTPKIEFLQ